MSHAHAQARPLTLLAIVAAFALALSLPALAGAKGKGHHGHHRAHVHNHHQGKHGKGHGHHGKRHGHRRHGHRGHGHRHHGHDRGKGKVVNTMTRNLYLGANLLPAIGAKSPEQLGAANGQILREVVANDFPHRAKGLAAEILEQKPDLVGLQEVALWQTTPLSETAASIEYDYLAELMAELNAGKDQYRVVVVQQEFDLESPGDYNEVPNDGPLPNFPNSELLGRLTMRDVILARNGAGVQTWNEGGGNFEALQEINILGEELFIDRGWTQTDAKVRGSHPFRFVNTHLEAFNPLIRLEQAEELVAPGGPATSELPVVLVGDLNSDDETVEFPDTLAYEYLLGAGMVERSTDDPLSCCLDSSLLEVGQGGSEADFDHQVDHIMTRDPETVTLQSSTVTGIEPVDGFWNSDHAGITSALRFSH